MDKAGGLRSVRAVARRGLLLRGCFPLKQLFEFRRIDQTCFRRFRRGEDFVRTKFHFLIDSKKMPNEMSGDYPFQVKNSQRMTDASAVRTLDYFFLFPLSLSLSFLSLLSNVSLTQRRTHWKMAND